MKKVLVLSNSLDGLHTESVIEHVNDQGVEVFRYDSDTAALGHIAVKFWLPDGQANFEIHSDRSYIDRDTTGAAWYRRPNTFNFPTTNNSLEEALTEEIKTAQEGIFHTIGESTWLNSPQNIRRANQKILQLQAAETVGLTTPDSVVTNNPDTLTEFLDQYKKIVFKPLASGHFQHKSETMVLYSTILDQDNCPDPDFVRNTPCYFQEYVPKLHELRVTIVGEEDFTAKVITDDEAADDWRKHQFTDHVSFSETMLDSTTKRQCLELMNRFGLNHAIFDLIVKPGGEIVFLEVNPNGQWYWLEEELGFPISETLAKRLVSICHRSSASYPAG